MDTSGYNLYPGYVSGVNATLEGSTAEEVQMYASKIPKQITSTMLYLVTPALNII